MKRLLIGGLAVGSLLFAASGVAAANTSATPLAAPAIINLNALTLTSSVSGGSWPLSGTGGMTVSFATPAAAQRVSGYAVTCTAPLKNADATALLPLPKIVATFEVDPSTGASADVDYKNLAGTVSLKVGPYSVVDGTHLPPLACTIVASNAGGASKAGLANKATAPAPTGDCSVDTATVGTGLESVLGGGSLAPFIGPNGTTGALNNKAPTGPVLPLTVTGVQKASNFDIVIANLSAFPGGSPAVPFCTTNNNYEPHLLSDQAVSFSPALSVIPAVTLPAAAAHPAQVKFTALGLTAGVKSTSTLTVAPGSKVLYGYDAAHFHIDSCPSSAALLCVTDTTAIVNGGAPAPPPGVGYIAVIQTAGQTVLPGKSIIGAPATMTFSKNVFTQLGTGTCDHLTGPLSATCVPTSALGAFPAALGIAFGGAQTTIAVGVAPGVPVQVAPPGAVIEQLTGGATDGGDLNYKSAIAVAPSALF